ncbi:hypothetical protein AB0H37_34745 [Actinomadura sp. NPDC023710]|uniref:hypothetical protein n=1 Tax=Actinomadura sp. NPDC023710 TaxID=3158219 RepID=UPI0033C0EF88
MTEDRGSDSSRRSETRRNRRTHQTPRRGRALFVALSEDEHALLVTAAQRERLATGAWAAQVLLAVASQAERADYVELREALAAVMHAAGQARRIGVNLNQVVAALHAGDPPAQLQWYAEAAARTVRKLDDLADELRRSLP